jgi:hypothetical protein
MESFGCKREKTEILTKLCRRKFPRRFSTASIQLTYKIKGNWGGGGYAII